MGYTVSYLPGQLESKRRAIANVGKDAEGFEAPRAVEGGMRPGSPSGRQSGVSRKSGTESLCERARGLVHYSRRNPRASPDVLQGGTPEGTTPRSERREGGTGTLYHKGEPGTAREVSRARQSTRGRIPLIRHVWNWQMYRDRAQISGRLCLGSWGSWEDVLRLDVVFAQFSE